MVLRFDESSALVVVDVQNDFADPRGGLYVGDGDAVIAPVNRLVRQASDAGALVTYTQDWHPPATPHFVTGGGGWPVHCVRDTWGAQLHPDLDVRGEVVRKGVGGEDGYSGFTVRDPVTGATDHTALVRIVQHGVVRRVVVVGLAGDVCVKATALDARELGLETAVVWPATRCVNLRPGDDVRARDELIAGGVVVTDDLT